MGGVTREGARRDVGGGRGSDADGLVAEEHVNVKRVDGDVTRDAGL